MSHDVSRVGIHSSLDNSKRHCHAWVCPLDAAASGWTPAGAAGTLFVLFGAQVI